MQTKNHRDLMHDVNDALAPFRAANPELMQGFWGGWPKQQWPTVKSRQNTKS